MVDCQNFPSVHLNKTAQRKLGVTNPQLLRLLKGDPLQKKPHGKVKKTTQVRTARMKSSIQHAIEAIKGAIPYDGCGPPDLL